MLSLIRKVSVFTEDLLIDEGRAIENGGWRIVVAAAVIRNPWHGRGHVDDLSPEAIPAAEFLGGFLAQHLLDELGGPDKIEAYGKSAVVGLGGEIEHTSAIIHTSAFGAGIRALTGSTGNLYSTNLRAPAGSCITIPVTHKNDDSLRDYYMSFDAVITDAPFDDEIVIALTAAAGPRPFARLGNRKTDRVEMAAEQAAAAGAKD